jgi:prepilin-type N-terminal cleavage/methylation domain-containing protein
MISRRKQSRGFSLVEMLISVFVLLVITSAAFYALRFYQQTYRSTRLRASMHEGVRGVAELMTQEIGQAGLLNFTPRTTTTAVAPSAIAQSVTLNSVDSIFVGEALDVDLGSNEEAVTVTAINVNASSITAVFTAPHGANAMVRANGVFPQGVLSSSTANELRLFGDINNDGTVVYLKYACDTAAGTFTRSITKVTPTSAAANVPETLLTNLIANPSAAPCFQYTTVTSGAYTFVTSVGVTLSVRTAAVDPQTRQYGTMTKSFLNLAPRNILSGLNLAVSGNTDHLQTTPPNIPLT